MAEIIKLSVEADKEAIFVYDATGSFNKSCNPGGWGTPNLEATDIEEATVEVFPPESEIGIIIDVLAALPNKDGIGFEILAEELNFTEIPSGVWRFVYRVSRANPVFEQIFSITKYFDEVIACCVDKLLVETDVIDLISDNNKKRIEMEMLLDNARWAACKGDFKAAQTIANHLNNQCKCCK